MVIMPNPTDNEEYIGIILSQVLLKGKRLCPAINAPYTILHKRGLQDNRTHGQQRSDVQWRTTIKHPVPQREFASSRTRPTRVESRFQGRHDAKFYKNIHDSSYKHTSAPTALTLLPVTYREYPVPGNPWTS
jgi:hypothetical protein